MGYRVHQGPDDALVPLVAYLAGTTQVSLGHGGGGGTPVTPALTSVTESTGEGTNPNWPVDFPAYSAGDLVIVFMGWDDGTDTPVVTSPTISGETWEDAQTIITSSNGSVRGFIRYFIAQAGASATTLNYTSTTTEQYAAVVAVVPDGDFDATTPFGTFGTPTTGGVSPINTPSISTVTGDGDGLVIAMNVLNGSTTITGTAPTGWTDVSIQTSGTGMSFGVATRDAAVTAEETVASASWGLSGSNTWFSTACVLRPGTASATPFSIDIRATDVAYAQTVGSVEFGNSWDRTYPVAVATNKRVSGFRFQVDVDQGATITTATLKTTHSQIATWVAPNDDLDLYAEAADSTTLATNEPDAQSKSENLGSESVVWSINGSQGNGVVFTSPSLVDVIQEVVNRPGWVSGNFLTLWAISTGGGSTDAHQMWAVAGVAEADRPRLEIEGTS